MLVIFLFSLTLRLIFAFYIQKFLYGEYIFTNSDTFSYVKAFVNFVEYQSYSFDLTHPDASFFRPPVYPFFWGLHYLIFGNAHAFHAIAVSQSVIDSFSVLLIYLIALELRVRPSVALVIAFLHAVNPFQIIWVPITATEILSTFVVLLITFLMLRTRRLSPQRLLWLGVFIGLATLLRQYLGLLLFSAGVAVAIASRFEFAKTAKGAGWLVAGFCLTLSPWVLRNWINHDAPYVLMGETRGYYNYGPDAVAFERLFNKFDENITSYFFEAARQGEVNLSAFELAPGVEALTRQAVTLAHRCGPSFIEARGERTFDFEERDRVCEARVVEAFDRARHAYRASVGFLGYHRTKLDALAKSIFKSRLARGEFENDLVNTTVIIAFFGRTIIIICGFLSIIFLTKESVPIQLFPILIYIYITAIIIHTEMRYLIQADAILLVLSGFTLDRLSSRIACRVA